MPLLSCHIFPSIMLVQRTLCGPRSGVQDRMLILDEGCTAELR